MKRFFLSGCLSFTTLTLVAQAANPPTQQGQLSDELLNDPNVRVVNLEDGSRSVFTRSPDSRSMVKRTYNNKGTLELVTIYRTDANDNPLSCKIYDGKKTELFKVRYGYRKSDGQLVEEQMFDSRVRRVAPDGATEMPVRRFIYTYDTEGNRSAPIALNLIPGKEAQEVFKTIGDKASAYDRDLFEKKKANPNAKPVK